MSDIRAFALHPFKRPSKFLEFPQSQKTFALFFFE